MNKSIKIMMGLIALVVILGTYVFGSYNKLVSQEEEVNAQWAVVESKLQRRYDLIPNLVETVKGSMKQEQEVFGQIADARSKMAGTNSVEEKVDAANTLEGAIGRLLVVMENYPELKSNENVTRLMDELAGSENRISVERDRYNGSVMEYNKSIKTFPKNIIAKIFNFESMKYFESNKEAQNAPKVNL